MIDSAIETDRRSGSTVLGDAPTKTASQRGLTLDAPTLAVVERERAPLEEYGPWMFNVGGQEGAAREEASVLRSDEQRLPFHRRLIRDREVHIQ